MAEKTHTFAARNGPLPTARQSLIGLITLLALGLRLWQIEQLPPGFHFDESFEGLEAWRILTDTTYRPLFLTGNFGVPPLNAYLNAMTFGLWRALDLPLGPLPMRVTAAIAGTLGVVALYGLARELRNSADEPARLSAAFPLLAAAVLALMRWHIHFSRMGIEPIYVPLLWSVALWLLLRGRRTGQGGAYVGCGIALAAGMYAYQGAWITPFVLALSGGVLLYQLRWSRRTPAKPGTDRPGTDKPGTDKPRVVVSATPRTFFTGLLITGAVAALLFAPLAWLFWQQPDLLLTRPAQLTIVGETTSPADSGVLASIWATAKMYGPVGEPGDLDPRRNLPGAPALSFWFALPFFVGLGLALWRFWHATNALILIGLVGLLAPGVVSEYAPHFHRILGAAAPTALLCALGLDWLWRRREWRPIAWRLHVGQWATIGLLLVGGFTEAQNYFVRWAALPDLFHAFDVGLWRLGQQIAATPATTSLYLTPRSADHATLAFAWTTRANAHPPPVTFDGRHIFPMAADDPAGTEARPAQHPEEYVVIEHEDFRTRLLLPGLFPTATITAAIRAPDGTIYAQTYVRAPGTPVARQPQHFLQANQQPIILGDGIALLGYDLLPATVAAGDLLYVQLYWLVNTAPTADWTVFVHLLRADGAGELARVAGHDSRPGAGSLPTVRWQAGWQLLDEHQLPLPADLPGGDYVVAIGLYQPAGPTLPPAGRLQLGSVQLE